MKTNFSIQKNAPVVSFKALNKIDKTAYKIAGSALKEAHSAILRQSADVDVEIIGKKGLLTKIKSLIIFVTKQGEKTGEWSSLSLDPKGYLPTEHRYKTIPKFTPQNITTALEQAKSRLNKRNPHLERPALPADIVLLKPLFEKLHNSCKIQ